MERIYFGASNFKGKVPKTIKNLPKIAQLRKSFRVHFPPSYDNHAPELLHAPRYIYYLVTVRVSSKSDNRDQSYAQ